jgi:hypothetical protein
MTNPVIYVASPYSHDNPAIMEERYHLALIACARLISLGAVVYSPIVHGHAIAQTGAIATDFKTWEKQCLTMLDKADVLLVLMLSGWTQSVGVNAEINHFRPTGKLVIHSDLNSLNSFLWDRLETALQACEQTAKKAA